MEQKKKILKKIMQIEFFAKRFGINPKNAEWSLIKFTNEDGLSNLIPAVYIGDDIYVDILADEVKCLYNVGGCVSIPNQAKVVLKKEGNYLFKSEKLSYECKGDEIYNLYKNKFVFQETLLEAKCVN